MKSKINTCAQMGQTVSGNWGLNLYLPDHIEKYEKKANKSSGYPSSAAGFPQIGDAIARLLNIYSKADLHRLIKRNSWSEEQPFEESK